MSILIKQVLLNNQKTDILITDNKITKIAPAITTSISDEVIDGEGKAVFPAFYNMHTHASMVLLRGIGEDKNLFDWLSTDIWPREDKITSDMMYKASRMAILEMIHSGTVFFNDMYFHMKKTVQAVDEMGIRAMISPCAMDLFDPQKTLSEKQKILDFMAYKNPCSRVKKGLSCHAVYTVSDELFEFCSTINKQHNLYLHIHLSETQEENDTELKKTGMTPAEHLDKYGLLTPKTILAHCVHLSDNDQDLLKGRGCLIAHCPTANLKLNSGQMPFDTYHKKGLPISLGTDGASSNNSLSMFSEMKVGALSAKGQSRQIEAGCVNEIIQAATYTGAQYLGLNAGKIQEGFLADFMLIDLNNTLTHPLNYLNSHFVYSLDSSCVSDVCCNGRFVMRNYHVPDQNKIIDEFDQVSKELL